MSSTTLVLQGKLPNVSSIIKAPEQWMPHLGCQPPDHKFNLQLKIFNSRTRILLISGSRKSGKTWAVLQRIVRHLWETPGARIGIFAKSKGLAKEAGSWQDLCERTIPEWCESGMVNPHTLTPFAITTLDREGTPGPKVDGETRSTYIRVRNYYGGESEARLFSIDNEGEVASKIKNKSFSMIYFIELSMFKDRRVLSVTLPSLRMPHLKPKQANEPDVWHQWIADTNPDEDLGDQSWIYDVFYRERLKKRGDSLEERRVQKYYDSMDVIEMFVEDNPYVTEQEVIELEGSCEGDPALYDSYVKGIWGQAGRKRNRFFAPLFSKEVHVVGGGDEEGDRIDLSPTTTQLHGGWDIGSSVNHAAVLIQKREVRVPVPGPKDQPPSFHILSYWDVLDEIVSINERIGLREFTEEVLKKIREIEQKCGKKLLWMHWSDDSALNVWRPTSETYDYLEIQAHSRSEIILQGVDKPPHSVKARVRLLQSLLKDNRIYVSARCAKVIAMLEGCQRGEVDKEYVKWDEHKHVFDALTYPLYMECRDELWNEAVQRPNASMDTSAAIVSV